MSEQKTLFEKIADKEIPSTIVFEDDKCVAFRDINPVAPTHIVLVPRVCGNLSQLRYAKEDQKELLGHLLFTAKEVALKEGLEDGYRIVINDGEIAGQTVFHLHIHIIGGKKLGWPPC